MKVKILTHIKTLMEEEAAEVVLPGEDGEFSVMDFHQPCLHSLRAGKITIKYKSQSVRESDVILRPKAEGSDVKILRPLRGLRMTEERVAIKRGVVRIEPLKVVVLIET